ncbi:hypothetical protein WR25_24757 [Diploscapter pachys]|uniref:Uncharacterized protein n=1 Tax=Diploscapter pachys TaxID=2018661 RepID=A0A2A2KF85_9BILA|nr:hypothetical protein WR25_24757 [Diploscapter pachys]
MACRRGVRHGAYRALATLAGCRLASAIPQPLPGNGRPSAYPRRQPWGVRQGLCQGRRFSAAAGPRGCATGAGAGSHRRADRLDRQAQRGDQQPQGQPGAAGIRGLPQWPGRPDPIETWTLRRITTPCVGVSVQAFSPCSCHRHPGCA